MPAREPAERKPLAKKQADQTVPAPKPAEHKPPAHKPVERKAPAREPAERKRPPPPLRSAQTPSPEALTAATEEFNPEESMMGLSWAERRAWRSGSRVSDGGPEIGWMVSAGALSKLKPCDLDRLVPHTRK